MKGKPTVGKQVDVAKALALYSAGLSINEVGRRLGHHHSVIAYHLKRHNIEIRSQKVSQRKPISSHKISKMYLLGKSAVEIAEELGVTYQCIYDRLAETGTKTRSRRDQIKQLIARGRYNIRKGPQSKLWRGGTTIDKNGYRQINIDGKYVPEHRLVWEKHHGKLMKGWIVHHLNGNKLDNRLKNLIALPRKMHSPKAIVDPFRQRIRELEKQVRLLKKLSKTTSS